MATLNFHSVNDLTQIRSSENLGRVLAIEGCGTQILFHVPFKCLLFAAVEGKQAERILCYCLNSQFDFFLIETDSLYTNVTLSSQNPPYIINCILMVRHRQSSYIVRISKLVEWTFK